MTESRPGHFPAERLVDLAVMMVVVVMVMHRMCASNGRNGDCGKNDESDQVAHGVLP